MYRFVSFASFLCAFFAREILALINKRSKREEQSLTYHYAKVKINISATTAAVLFKFVSPEMKKTSINNASTVEKLTIILGALLNPRESQMMLISGIANANITIKTTLAKDNLKVSKPPTMAAMQQNKKIEKRFVIVERKRNLSFSIIILLLTIILP